MERILRFKMDSKLGNKNGLKHDDNSLKQLKTANPNSQWAYIRKGLYKYWKNIWVRDLGAYFQEGLFLERLIIGILW